MKMFEYIVAPLFVPPEKVDFNEKRYKFIILLLGTELLDIHECRGSLSF